MPRESPRAESSPVAFGVVAALFLGWCALFIQKSTFVVGGRRYFCLIDDAMISMTYARSVAEGFGLNWARWGDPVEGFTCPLWTAILVPLQYLGAPLEVRSLFVQLLGVAILVANLFVVRRIAVRHFEAERAIEWLPPVLLTATFYPLNYWSLLGMETGLQTLLLTSSVSVALDLVEEGPGRGRRLFPLLALLLLLRPDTAVPVAAIVLFIGWEWRVAGDERGLRAVGTTVAGLAAVTAGLFAARFAYFGELLPNTYHLKLEGVPLAVRVLRGADAVAGEAWPAAWVVVPALLFALVRAFGAGRSRGARLALAIVLLAGAYSIYVGGDVWEGSTIGANRWLAPAAPLLFLLVGSALQGAVRRARPAARFVLVAGSTLAAFVLVNGLALRDDSAERRRHVRLAEKPQMVGAHRTQVVDVRYLERTLRPEATVATVWAGIPAYFSDFRMADVLGYNDRHIARRPPSIELSTATALDFVPGHVKWDYDYLLGTIRPDALLRTHGLTRAEIRRLAERYGYVKVRDRVWLRRDSEHVLPTAPDRERWLGRRD